MFARNNSYLPLLVHYIQPREAVRPLITGWKAPTDNTIHMGHAAVILLSQTTGFLAPTHSGIIHDDK